MQSSGYSVFTELRHSGYTKTIYWSLDLAEARTYAEMVERNHGQQYRVYVSQNDNKIWESR
jgi:hypothetical protein